MGFYRSIPIVKEAFQLTRKIADGIVEWIGEENIAEYNTGEFAEDDCYINIKTLEGVMTAEEGDWVIKGVNGEFYPCKDDIFRKSYEAYDANP